MTLYGHSNRMWDPESPHTETTWPNSREVIDRNFAGQSAEAKFNATLATISGSTISKSHKRQQPRLNRRGRGYHPTLHWPDASSLPLTLCRRCQRYSITKMYFIVSLNTIWYISGMYDAAKTAKKGTQHGSTSSSSSRCTGLVHYRMLFRLRTGSRQRGSRAWSSSGGYSPQSK